VARLLEKGVNPASLFVVTFTRVAAASLVKGKSRAFGEVVATFVQSGDLTLEDSAALHLQCRIEVVDDRPLPHADLPEVAGRWCVAPPSDADSRLP
jgi:hypothetical protein